MRAELRSDEAGSSRDKAGLRLTNGWIGIIHFAHDDTGVEESEEAGFSL